MHAGSDMYEQFEQRPYQRVCVCVFVCVHACVCARARVCVRHF